MKVGKTERQCMKVEFLFFKGLYTAAPSAAIELRPHHLAAHTRSSSLQCYWGSWRCVYVHMLIYVKVSWVVSSVFNIILKPVPYSHFASDSNFLAEFAWGCLLPANPPVTEQTARVDKTYGRTGDIGDLG